MDNLKIVDASMDGTVTYEFYMAPNFSNLNGKSTTYIHPVKPIRLMHGQM
jgi:hypothetical protein